MNTDQMIVVAFLNALKNGKTTYPLNLEINKMGKEIEIVFRLKLSKEETTLKT